MKLDPDGSESIKLDPDGSEFQADRDHLSGGDGGVAEGAISQCPFSAVLMALEPTYRSVSAFSDIPEEHIVSERPSPRNMLQPRSPMSLRRQHTAKLTCPMTGSSSPFNSISSRLEGAHSNQGSEHLSRRSKALSRASKGRQSRAVSSRVPDSKCSTTQSRVLGSRKRRVKRIGGFSAWEAAAYSPAIVSSWNKALSLHSLEDIGLIFYDKLFVMIPEVQHMFTSAKEIQAQKFSGMLCTIVNAVDSHSDLTHKLRELAPMHLEKGVKSEHMPRMGEVLFAVLRQVIGDDWDPTIQAAWEWLWAWLSRAMDQSLEAARYDESILSRSWDIAMDNCPDHDMGDLFFDTLFEFAPNLKSVYHQPKQLLSGKFVEMLATLVGFYGADQRRVDEQITWLGIRHVHYNAKPQHTKVLGEVVIKAMERAVGDEWTEEMAQKWTGHWETTCQCLFEVMGDAEKYAPTVEQVATLNKRIKDDPNPTASRLKTFTSTGSASSEEAATPRPSSPEGTPGGGGWNLLRQSVSESARQSRKRSIIGNLMAPATPTGDSPVAGSWTLREQSGESVGKPARLSRKRSIIGNLMTPLRTRSSNSDSNEFQFLFQRGGSGGSEERAATNVIKENSVESDEIGKQFWDMLKTCISLIWQPERQNEDLIVRATAFYQWGIRSSQLEKIGEAVHATFRAMYGPNWTENQADAWRWFWKVLCGTLERTLRVWEDNDAEVLGRTWALAQDRESADELGERFFKTLNRIAPHVVQLFKRPKKIQAHQFIQVVDFLVMFAEDPSAFFKGFRALVIRHIKYGVKAEFTKPFGQAILLTIEAALGDDWDERTSKAWNDTWIRVSSCISRSLNVGSNLLVVALVEGDLFKLQQSARCAARSLRDRALTEVNVNGDKLSPLRWAIREGQFKLVEWILQDLLEIRADRDTYYYGRKTLFEEHRDIIEILCKECPAILDTLFDGLLWHSQFVNTERGTVRVNYYIEDIYGEPEKHPEAWTSPLGVLVLAGQPTQFLHPVVIKVLEMKWDGFCKYWFLAMQCWFLFLLACLMITNVFLPGNCHLTPVRAFLAIAGGLTASFQTVVFFRQYGNGQSQRVRLIGPVSLSQGWGNQEAQANLNSLSNISSRRMLGRVITAFVVLILCTQAMQIFVFSTRLAALTWNLGIMVADVSRNLVVSLIFLLAFSSALSALHDVNFESFGEGMWCLSREVLKLSPPSYDGMHPMSHFFVFSFVIVTNIGMIAVLIAQIRSSYAVISKNRVGFAMQHRASICVDLEALLPLSYRTCMFKRHQFDKPVPLDHGDAGPEGGIQVEEPASIRQHPRYVPDRIKRYTGEASEMDPWDEEDGDPDADCDQN